MWGEDVESESARGCQGDSTRGEMEGIKGDKGQKAQRLNEWKGSKGKRGLQR